LQGADKLSIAAILVIHSILYTHFPYLVCHNTTLQHYRLLSVTRRSSGTICPSQALRGR
jgi:hypothetical protein